MTKTIKFFVIWILVGVLVVILTALGQGTADISMWEDHTRYASWIGAGFIGFILALASLLVGD